MDHFNPVFVNLSACPHYLISTMEYPSICIIYALLALVSAIFTIWTALRYNSVMVYNRPERKPSISNTWWVWYFLGITVRSIVESIKFAIIDIDPIISVVLIIESLVMYGVCTLMISYALQHQKQYRSKFAHNPAPSNEGGGSTMFNASISDSSTAINIAIKNETLKDKILSVRALYFAFFLVYCGGIFAVWDSKTGLDESRSFIFFLVAFGIQRLPVLILALYISFDFPESKVEGPQNSSRIILFIAAILDTINNIPVTLWAEIISDSTCLFGDFSRVDIIHMLFFFAQNIILYIFKR